jgi:hypothetical protein
MKTLALACLAAAALALPAIATPGGCLSLTDPAGDERRIPAGAPTSGTTDLLAVDVVPAATDVTAVFRLAAPADPPPGMSYEYSVTFEDADTVWGLRAAIEGGTRVAGNGPYELLWRDKTPPPPPPDPISAEHTASHHVTVSGSVDLVNDLVTITAPASAFGAATLTGAAWTVTDVSTARGAYLTSYGPIDNVPAAAGVQLVAGDGACA